MFESLEEADKNINLPFNYFHYEGSSTVPGCEEYVGWYIVDTPLFVNNVVL
jgi:carbonic anhydrase